MAKMTEQELKNKILALLENNNYSKAQMKDILWVESDRLITRVLRGLRKEDKIFYVGSTYTLTSPPKVSAVVQKKKPLSLWLLRGLFSLMAMGASIMSVRNTSVWLLTMFPAFFAFLLSSIMSIFMIASAGVIVFLIQQKKYVAVVPIGILWLIITLTSMSSTVIGMYDSQKPQLNKKIATERIDNTTKMQYSIYEQQIMDIEGVIQDKKTSLERFNRLIASYDTLEKRDADRASYNALAWAVSDAEAYIRKQTDVLRGVREKMLVVVSEQEDVVFEAKTFYEEMEGITGLTASLVQFILSCFVACLVDVVAPLSAGLALFLKEEE